MNHWPMVLTHLMDTTHFDEGIEQQPGRDGEDEDLANGIHGLHVQAPAAT
jgi:hypothetical protein